MLARAPLPRLPAPAARSARMPAAATTAAMHCTHSAALHSLSVSSVSSVSSARSLAAVRRLSRRPLLSLASSPLLQRASRALSVQTQVGAPLRKKVTSVDLLTMKQRGQKISMVTAYTYPSAVHVDAAGIDAILVGDSVAMVELGYDTTLPVTVDEMLYHCKAVARGADRALLVGDLPFGSYEASPQQAYATAIRFLKEAQMDCVKLEGGAGVAEHVRTLVNGGVAVMGHIGLTPQRISVLGGFRAQGKTTVAAQALLADALALQAAGCFALVIECVPAEVAELITRTLRIPTIGIGAGNGTSGQILVFHDLLGMFQHAHHAKVTPSFCKTYAHIGAQIQVALNSYKQEVETQLFPGELFSPYKLNAGEREKFKRWADKHYQQMELQKKKEEAETAAAEENENIKVY